MLGWLSERTKMARLAGLWHDATHLDPGDGGQVAVMASNMIKASGMRPEDAWLAALTNWIFNHPYPDTQRMLANAAIRFLDIYEHSAGLSPECRAACRHTAEYLLAPATDTEAEYMRLERQVAELARTVDVPRSKAEPKSTKASTNINKQLKDELYMLAVETLSFQLCEKSYEIIKIADDRSDIPSLEIEKDGELFHVMLHVDIFPSATFPPNFSVNTFRDTATDAGATLLISHATAFAAADAEAALSSANAEFAFDPLKPASE
ncbi:MAG: hypothetical protein CMK74_05395 [Pseudomonadales bacterium]|nr:hypothetical protein [Pseudomonadales bacterium]|tara:strand:- start:13111 stop:13902 length:792 start_codon:yes stop_codon:yes gene_type:complete